MLLVLYSIFMFFFKQKPAYEMRISDWSSDVCSSDLQSDLATSGDITSLDTRVTTAETDITARPTSAQLAAPEGAAGIGYANSDVKDKLAENRSLLDYWLAIDIDYTNAISRAEVAGIRALLIPDGVFDLDNIALTDFHIRTEKRHLGKNS